MWFTLSFKRSRNNKDLKIPEEENLEGTSEYLQEKRKRKEAKENQTEEFYRDKFLFKERELLKEMTQWAAKINEVPIGRDRTFKRYYRLIGLNQMLVENDDNGTELLLDLKRHEREDADFESDDDMVIDIFTPNPLNLNRRL